MIYLKQMHSFNITLQLSLALTELIAMKKKRTGGFKCGQQGDTFVSGKYHKIPTKY